MSGFERKFLPNGQENPKYVDLCDEDTPLAGQKFACMSFISPEKILKKREQFLFEQFVKQWDFTKSMTKFSDFLQFISFKYNLKVDDIMKDMADFAKEEESRLREESVVDDDFKNFIDKHEAKLNEDFNRQQSFQTSVRGLKIRGVFPTQEEAESRCKKIRESDPNHDIFVGPVGIWIPWDPDAYKTGRVEFMEEELNQLHQEKIKNEERAKQEFDKRIRETKLKAIQDNIKNAEKSGNVLTQTIDEDGNLIGVKETVDFDSREDVTPESIKLHNEMLYNRVNNVNTSTTESEEDAQVKEA
uniref:Uncharacterized protein n=1 Tax=viral metagenome TaxID=1070528 RepID=A0A6C0DV25_9ZZZZ